jgi:hypothetical protein
MLQLRNIRHEQFARFVADGLPQSEAYRRVVGKGASAKNANVHADEWTKRLGVQARIERVEGGELPEGDAKQGEDNRVLVQRNQYLGCQGRSGLFAPANQRNSWTASP